MAITTLLVDLDDTVYPASSGIWVLIRERIGVYMQQRLKIPQEKVGGMRKELFLTYGTTLRGLQAIYNIDQAEYLSFVHDVPVSDLLNPDTQTRQALQRFPQRKIIFTNADSDHAKRVLHSLDIEDCFDSLIDIRMIAPYCKPMTEAFQTAMQIAGIKDPGECAMVDDSPANLSTARQLGMVTVLVGGRQFPPADGHATISCLAELPYALPQDLDLKRGGK